MKKLSIVITCYNQEKYISQCIDSALRQKEIENFEIIIGDDCSTDTTSDIVKKYQKNYPNCITVLPRVKNLGMQKNLQDCFAHCSGEFIAICEGDDYWTDPLKCKKMLEAFSHHPSAILCFHNIQLLDNGKFLEHAQSFKNNLPELVTPKDVLFPRNLICNFSCCMYRRKILDIVPNDFYQPGNADWLFNMYALNDNKGIYIPETLSVYRLVSTSIWSSQTAYTKAQHLLTSCWKYNQIFNNKYSDELLDFAVRAVQRAATDANNTPKDNISQLNNKIDRLAIQLEEIKQSVKPSFFNKICCSKKKIKNNIIYKKYYFLGINIFKRKIKTANYQAFLGIKQYKYIHILHKTIISTEIVKLINKYFSTKEHAFIFVSGADENIAGKLFAPNIFYGDINTLQISPQITDKIIIHGMFSQNLVSYLYNNPDLLKNAYWAIWGGRFIFCTQ